jgi:hypothetical protein
MTQKNVKLSGIVASQLPDFVRDQYPTFIAFLKAYYEFLESNNLTRNLEYIRDIDRTLDVYIGYLKKEIGTLSQKLSQDRFFLKHAKEVYVSRGSEESYKFLFRLLYNKEIETQTPGDKMFKISGGIWEQDVSFFIKVTSGTSEQVFQLENDYLYITSTSANGVAYRHRVYVNKIQAIDHHPGFYEVFVNRQFSGIIQPGDIINQGGVKATVQPTTTKVIIENPGTGFKIGQIFNISTSVAGGLQVKVIAVDPVTGGLKKLQIISFGVGFEKDFVYNITRFQALVSSQKIAFPNIDIGDVIDKHVDFGYITKYDYHTDYMRGDYAGGILADFYQTNIPGEVEQTVATLLVKLGGVSVYPGFYKNSNSLLDEDSYIQDGYYYQDFSYLIKIDETLDSYRSIVTKTLHPVGRRLFGDYLIENKYDVNYEISNPVIRILIPLYSQSNETIGAPDKVISSVHTLTYRGNGTTNRFQWLDDNQSITVFLNAKIDRNIIPNDVDPITLYGSQYRFDGTDVLFYSTPYNGARIELTYATLNYSGSSEYISNVLDVTKSTSDVISTPTDRVDSKDVVKGTINDTLQSNDSNRTYYGEKLLPSVEILNNIEATDNQKDYFVMELTSRTNAVNKPVADSTSGAYDEETSLVSKEFSPTYNNGDSTIATENKDYAFTKVLNADNGYTDEALPSDIRTAQTIKVFPSSEILNDSGSTNNQKDYFVASEAIQPFVIQKRLDDASSISESLSNQFSKLLNDTYGASDAQPPITFNKYITGDSVTLSDSAPDFARSFAPIDDPLTLAETTSIGLTRGLSESISLTESTQFVWSKGLSDTLNGFTEVITGQTNPYGNDGYFPITYQDGYLTLN